MRDFASARGQLRIQEKWHDDTFEGVDYRIIVRATDARLLFYNGFTVRIMADDKKCLFTFNEAGILVVNNLAEVKLPDTYNQYQLLLDAKAIAAGWAAGEPRRLTEEEIARIEEQHKKAAASMKVKRELRGQLTKLQVRELLDQYDQRKGFFRSVTRDSALVHELSKFGETTLLGHPETAPLDLAQRTAILNILKRHQEELKRPAELTGQLFLSLMLALGEAAEKGEKIYKQLLPADAAKKVKHIDPEYVFVDSAGNVHSVVEIATRLLERYDFSNPVTGKPFETADEKRLVGYPTVAAAIERTEAGLRDQTGRVSKETIDQIRLMIEPIANFNQGKEQKAREKSQEKAGEAVGKFYEYTKDRLKPAEREALNSYRMPVEGAYYQGNEANTTFGEFFKSRLQDECNEASAKVLRNVVEKMSRGEGGEVEAERWARLRRDAQPLRVQLPELREEAESTEDVRRRREKSEKNKDEK